MLLELKVKCFKGSNEKLMLPENPLPELEVELLPKFANSNSDFPVSCLLLTWTVSREKVMLYKKLAARAKVEIVTQVRQLQFKFPCFPLVVDLDWFT